MHVGVILKGLMTLSSYWDCRASWEISHHQETWSPGTQDLKTVSVSNGERGNGEGGIGQLC